MKCTRRDSLLQLGTLAFGVYGFGCERTAQVFQPRPVFRAAAGAPRSQSRRPLSQMMPWDFHVSTLGSSSESEWTFCDQMPAVVPLDRFVPSSQSFSNNYAAFLALLDPEQFELKDRLLQALAVNQRPADQLSHRGWTQVVCNTTPNRWERAYTVPIHPTQWLLDVAGNANAACPADASNAVSDNLTNRADAGASVECPMSENFGVFAEAWGMVPIAPGEWFDSAIVAIAKRNNGPYLRGYTHADFFGDQGLIAQRISAFVVALNPSTCDPRADAGPNSDLGADEAFIVAVEIEAL